MAVRLDSSGQNVVNIGARRPTTTSVQPTVVAPPAPTIDAYSGSSAPAAPSWTQESLAADALNTPEYAMAQQNLANSLNLFRSQQAAERQRYDVNYENALRNLGWIPEATDVAGMASKGKWDTGELLSEQGKQTTAGKMFTDLLNDYAARGLSQSGMFAVARNAAQNRLNEQLRGVETGRTNYLQDLQTKESQMLAQQEAQRQEALNQAKQNILNQLMAQSGMA